MVPPTIALDHLVLTVRDVGASASWYERVLGMRRWETTDANGTCRTALYWSEGGMQWNKINLHLAGAEFLPHAEAPTPGSADLCFTIGYSLVQMMEHLALCGVPVETGPVPRTGSRRALVSVYVRDPDGNLIELAEESGPRWTELAEWNEKTPAATIQ